MSLTAATFGPEWRLSSTGRPCREMVRTTEGFRSPPAATLDCEQFEVSLFDCSLESEGSAYCSLDALETRERKYCSLDRAHILPCILLDCSVESCLSLQLLSCKIGIR